MSALYYFFRGYSKYAAPSYKAYMIICALVYQAIACENAVTVATQAKILPTCIVIATTCLSFGLFILLAVGNDIGKKRSYTICAIKIILIMMIL